MLTATLQTNTQQEDNYSNVRPPYIIISLDGQIDESNLHKFSGVIEPLLNSQHHNYLVFDLSELELINSHVVGYLHNTHKKLQAKDKRMAFVKANRDILEILEHVGIIEIVPNFDSEEALVRAIREGDI